MSTTSTIPTVEDQLVSKFATALATASASGGQVQVEVAWPGPATEPESVFLGYHPELRDIRLDQSSEIPTIKAGRKQRQEDYTVPVTVWVFRPDITAADAKIARDRAFTIAGLLEDVLADDPRVGLAPATVQSVVLASLQKTLWPFQKGWACELVMNIDVQARLT